MLYPFYMIKISEICPIRAPFLIVVLTNYRGNPVKSSDSVLVENVPKYRSVFKNTVDLHLPKSLPKVLKSR